MHKLLVIITGLEAGVQRDGLLLISRINQTIVTIVAGLRKLYLIRIVVLFWKIVPVVVLSGVFSLFGFVALYRYHRSPPVRQRLRFTR